MKKAVIALCVVIMFLISIFAISLLWMESPPPPCMYELHGSMRAISTNNSSHVLSYSISNLTAWGYGGCNNEIEDIELSIDDKDMVRLNFYILEKTDDKNWSVTLRIDDRVEYYKVVNRIDEWQFVDVNENGWMDNGDEILFYDVKDYMGNGLYIHLDYAGMFAVDGKTDSPIGLSQIIGDIP